MPQKSGLDVVAGIDPASLPLVIFVTAHDEHAIRAFDLHALDYLVKPYREDRLREAIGRARALVGRRQLGAFRQRVGAWVASQPAYPSRHPRRRTRTHSLRRGARDPVDRSAGLLRARASGWRAHPAPRHAEAIPPHAGSGAIRPRASIGRDQRASRSRADDHRRRRPDGATLVGRRSRVARGCRAELEERLRTLP